MNPDELGTTNSSKLQFPVVMSGTSYGYKNTSGTFVAFRGDSTGTYTYASGSTGGTVDMGARNNYRYVNASNVYAKGKTDGTTTHTATYTPTSRSSALDMGVNHSYRYVNTNSVPNTNSGTYTYAANSTGGKVDMGATNTYRYVDATNVYAKGKADGAVNYSDGRVIVGISFPGQEVRFYEYHPERIPGASTSSTPLPFVKGMTSNTSINSYYSCSWNSSSRYWGVSSRKAGYYTTFGLNASNGVILNLSKAYKAANAALLSVQWADEIRMYWVIYSAT